MPDHPSTLEDLQGDSDLDDWAVVQAVVQPCIFAQQLGLVEVSEVPDHPSTLEDLRGDSDLDDWAALQAVVQPCIFAQQLGLVEVSEVPGHPSTPDDLQGDSDPDAVLLRICKDHVHIYRTSQTSISTEKRTQLIAASFKENTPPSFRLRDLDAGISV